MRQPVPFGKYLLLDRISVGGMAEVFKAKSYGVEGFEKIIAIKRILPTMGEDRDFIKMFIDEAKIAGQLAHANICQIFELGRIDGSHFIAMEYIWGKDLLQIQNRIRKVKQQMPIPMACFAIAKVLEGLDYAHRKRDAHGRPLEIVHRDCSPQNVLVSYEGEVKVIDFGIAKATSRNSRTMAGVLKGKFGYMSPEQVRGLPLDRRSDIFALGTMLYECLTGERLFQGETDFSTLEKVRNVQIQPPRTVNPNIPEAVERVIMKALAKDVDDRYQWCSEMLADLQQYLMGQDVVFTAKTLSSWLKELFTPEIDRERAQLEQYKRVGRDGLIGGVAAVEANRDVVANLGEAGAPEGDATTLGGPSFEEMQAALNAGRAPTAPDEIEAEAEEEDFGEEAPTEIFGDDLEVPTPPSRAPSVSNVPRSNARASTQRPADLVAAPSGAHVAAKAQPPAPQMPYGQPGASPYPPNTYGYPPAGSDPGMAAGTPGSFPAGQPPQQGTNRTVLGMTAPSIPTQVPANYPFRQSGSVSTPPPMNGGASPSTPPPYQPPSATPYPPNPYPNQVSSPYPVVQSGAGPYGGYQAPYGSSGPYAQQPPYGMPSGANDVSQVRPKRSTLVRDVLIGVGIAAVVLGGFFAIKIFVLDKPAPAAAAAQATIRIALTPGVTADLIVDAKKVSEVVDKQEIVVPAGKRHVALVGRAGTKCDVEVTLDAGKTTTLKCDSATPPTMPEPTAGSATAGSASASPPVAAGSAGAAAAVPAVTAAGSASTPPPQPKAAAVVVPPALKTEPPKAEPPKIEEHKVEKIEATKKIETPKPHQEVVKTEPKAEGKGYVTITSKPSAHILVDGAETGLTTPISGHMLPILAGRHKITFVLGDDRYTFPVTVSAGQTASLNKDLE